MDSDPGARFLGHMTCIWVGVAEDNESKDIQHFNTFEQYHAYIHQTTFYVTPYNTALHCTLIKHYKNTQKNYMREFLKQAI